MAEEMVVSVSSSPPQIIHSLKEVPYIGNRRSVITENMANSVSPPHTPSCRMVVMYADTLSSCSTPSAVDTLRHAASMKSRYETAGSP